MVGHFAHVTIVGSLGVETFYVISGFLITWLLLEEHEATGTINKGTFWFRRTLRIFPAFYTFLLVNAAVLAGSSAMPRPAFWIAAATYTANYYVATHVEPSGALTHTWSLAVEEQFYLLWPIALSILLRKRRRTTIAALIGTMALITFWRCGLLWIVGVPRHYLQFALDTRADFLAVGALIAVAWNAESFRAFAARLTRWSWLPLISIGGLGFTAAFFGLAREFEVTSPVDVILLGVLLVQLMTLAGRGWWGILDRPLMRWLGTISYSLYLYHYLIWTAVGWVVSSQLARGILGALLAVPVAALSYYVIERPFLRLRERLRPATATPALYGSSVGVEPGQAAA